MEELDVHGARTGARLSVFVVADGHLAFDLVAGNSSKQSLLHIKSSVSVFVVFLQKLARREGYHKCHAASFDANTTINTPVL